MASRVLYLAVVALWLVPCCYAESSASLVAISAPLPFSKLTSTFGIRQHPVSKVIHHHNGIDLAAPVGTPIRAIRGGVVTFSNQYKGYGKLVVIMHADGKTSHYAHCNELFVLVGERVLRGEIIGSVGESGVATGAHLHLEIRDGGNPVNPIEYLRER
ncbi:M23 family metallopeptidase [bacterium]|nr:M23 family metallopeptidase [bacterium]